MEITWYGNSCFRITERGGFATVVTDPFDAGTAGYNPLKLKADIVTVSSNDLSHNNVSAVKGDPPFIIDGPGEYERGSVLSPASRPPPHCKPTQKTFATRSTFWITAISPFFI